MAGIWKQGSPREAVAIACEDAQPMMQANGDGGVRVELTGLRGSYWVELTRAECERIAEAIGVYPPGYFRPQADSDS